MASYVVMSNICEAPPHALQPAVLFLAHRQLVLHVQAHVAVRKEHETLPAVADTERLELLGILPRPKVFRGDEEVLQVVEPVRRHN